MIEHEVKETPWQGTYFVLLKPNTLLCASSDRYLESVLRRMDDTPGTRALPDNLPEWKHIDFDSSVWMLRHLPKSGQKTHTSEGLTATYSRQGVRVVYAPKIGSDQNLKWIEGSWAQWLTMEGLDEQKSRERLKVEHQFDRSVVVTISTEKGTAENFGLGFQLYWLQGQALVVPKD